jgi:hypothetical protein
MRCIRGIVGLSLLAVVVLSLAASGASAQSGIPEIPIGPGPNAMPSPLGLAEVVPASPTPSWGGLGLLSPGQPGWPLRFFVTHSAPPSHSAGVRALRGRELSVSRVTTGRFIKR